MFLLKRQKMNFRRYQNELHKSKIPKQHQKLYIPHTEDSVKAGDTVVTANGAKLTVTDETVDMKWVDTYGADKVAVVKKCDEPESGGDDES